MEVKDQEIQTKTTETEHKNGQAGRMTKQQVMYATVCYGMHTIGLESFVERDDLCVPTGSPR